MKLQDAKTADARTPSSVNAEKAGRESSVKNVRTQFKSLSFMQIL